MCVERCENAQGWVLILNTININLIFLMVKYLGMNIKWFPFVLLNLNLWVKLSMDVECYLISLSIRKRDAIVRKENLLSTIIISKLAQSTILNQ